MAFIKKIIETFDSSNAEGQACREALEGLSALAYSKIDLMEQAIHTSIRTAGSEENRTVPVAAIIGSKTTVRAFVSSNTDQLLKTVEDSLAGFITGTQEGVLTGISTLIAGALTVLLGESVGTENSMHYYYVATSGLVAIRLDISAWSRTVSATSIKTKVEKVTGVVAVKSVVDFSKISFPTFLALYAEQLQKAETDPLKFEAAIKEAKRIYDIFHEHVGALRDNRGDTVRSEVRSVVITQPPAVNLLPSVG